MRCAAASQDKIGWWEFMKGRISVDIAMIQCLHCTTAPCMMNGNDWTRHFISSIIQLSHSWWIFHNIALHDCSRGVIKLHKHWDVLLELDRPMEVDHLELPQESKFLLKIYFSSLLWLPMDKQSYWVRAMKAAWKSGSRETKIQASMGAGTKWQATKRCKPWPHLDVVMVELHIHYKMERQPPPTKQVQSSATMEIQQPSNKRLKKPD